MSYTKLIGIALIFLAGFGIAFTAQDLRYKAIIAIADKEQAEHVASNASANAALYRTQQIRTEKQRADYLTRVGEYNEQIRQLRNNLNNGTKRVYVHATCPALPGSSTDASGTERATAELDATARQDYINLVEAVLKNDAWQQRCYDHVNQL